MRTKAAEGIWRLELTATEPRPEVYLVYDGLGRISQRPILRDLIEELQRQGPEILERFLTALRLHHAGAVVVYFSDYVSYGIGGGDATAEFYFGRYLLLHDPPTPDVPERIRLVKEGVIASERDPSRPVETLLLEPTVNPPADR